MRFFLRVTERQTIDPQEYTAMLNHRLDSIAYQQQLLERGVLAYTFRANEGQIAIEMYETDTLEDLDKYIKGDPGFPYSQTEVIPVVSTQAMVKEASEYLGEKILSESEFEELVFHRKPLNPKGTYWLAWKEVNPFSPLLSQELQNDIHRRTVTSQRVHHSPLEYADDNPVGKAVGILIAEGSLEDVKAHVANCEVYPDTVVTFTQLMQLKDAWEFTIKELIRLQRAVPNESPFEQSNVSSA